MAMCSLTTNYRVFFDVDLLYFYFHFWLKLYIFPFKLTQPNKTGYISSSLKAHPLSLKNSSKFK